MKSGWTAVALVILILALSTPAPAQPAAPGPDAARRLDPAEARAQLLRAVGALATSHLYQAYLNIGFLADGRAAGTYADRDARHLLETVLPLLENVDRELEMVGRLDLDEDDRRNLTRLHELSSLLRQQGQELRA